MARKRGQGQMQHVIQAPKTRAIHSQQQSTETVQVLLFSSISTLFFTRGLFPDYAYEDVYLEEQTEPYKYDDIASRKSVAGNPTKVEGVDTHLLRRGRSTRADSFLDILENGVFEALRRKILDAIQIDVIADKEDRSRVLETYTFAIHYKESAELGRHVDGLRFQSPDDPTNDEDRIHENLITIIKQVQDRAESFKSGLPSERHMTATLLYVEGYDEDYEPPGFERSADNVVTFPHGNGWQKKTESFYAEDGDFHEVGLNVSFLQHEKRVAQKALRIGEGAEYSLRCPRFGDVTISEHHTDPDETDSADPSPASQPRSSSQRSVHTSQRGTPVTYQSTSPMKINSPHRSLSAYNKDVDLDLPDAPLILQRGNEEQVTNSMLQMDLNQSKALPTGNKPSQWDDDVRTKEDLQIMLEPDHVTQHSMPTQKVPGFSQEERHEIQNRYPNHAPDDHLIKYSFLTQKKALDLWAEQERQEQHRHAGQIWCQCEFENIEGETISCSICGASQHLECYGYLGLEDPRLPKHHVCYDCLLSEDKISQLSHMARLAQLRLTMHIILMEELFEEPEIRARLADFGLQSTAAGALVDQIIFEGYLTRPRRTQRHSQPQQIEKLGVPAAAQGKRAKEKLLKLFDPFLHIDQHYAGFVSRTAAEKASSIFELLVTRYAVLTPAQLRRAINGSEDRSSARTPAAQVNVCTGSSTSSAAKDQVRTRTPSDQAKRLHDDPAGPGDGEDEMSAGSSMFNKKPRAEVPSTSSKMMVRRTPRRAEWRRTGASMSFDVTTKATPDGSGRM